MKLAASRSGFILVLAALLQACGGGSGAQPNIVEPPPAGSPPRVTLNTQSISVSATPGDIAPLRLVVLTVTNPPAAGLWVEGQYTASGIETLEFSSTSPTQGSVTIRFRSPGSLQNATYTDNIQLRVCTDQACTTQIAGSPATIETSYIVSGAGTTTGILDRDSITIAADTNEQNPRTETARITLTPPPAAFVQVQITSASSAIREVRYWSLEGTNFNVDVEFHAGRDVGPGTYTGAVTVTICYDSSCVRQVQGSPFTIQTTMTVGEGPEPGVAPLEVASRLALPHNVIDAEFSKALNRIAMVATYPENALYVYDVASGTERQQPLVRAPTSVSISPDGLTAAVGHDALITVIDLATIGEPGAPSPVHLDVTTQVGDLILDGNGYVHALRSGSTWSEIHSVQIATNTEQLNTGRAIYAGARGRLHPSGDYLYTADNGQFPSDIEKWDIRSGRAEWLYDSPYHGDHEMCGNLWFNEAGSTIFTACGNTFRSSTTQAQDMSYSGALELSVRDFNRFMIRSLSQSVALDEIVLVEYDAVACAVSIDSRPCYQHLVFYESEFFNRLALYSLAPVTVDGTAYGQRGLFVFHDAVNTNKYLISMLSRMADPAAEYYLSVVP